MTEHAAAITNAYFSYGFGGQKSKIEVSTGLVLAEDSRGESIPSTFWLREFLCLLTHGPFLAEVRPLLPPSPLLCLRPSRLLRTP